MSLTWTKKFTSADDGSVLTGTQLGQLQDDIDVAVTDVDTVAYVVTFGSASADQTVYCVAPVTGTVDAVYVVNYSSARAGGYTVRNGSAGVVIATGTATTGVAGLVSTMALGTVSVTVGGSIGVTRATMGSDGVSSVTIVFTKDV
jgi:hypothetical protein